MSAKSICLALFVLVAVTLVSGQYLLTTTYEDSSCTTENGLFTSESIGADCTSNSGCFQSFGFYFKQSCVDTDPFASPPTTLPLLYDYNSNDLSCTNYRFAEAAPLNKCTASHFVAFKLSGCSEGNNTLLLTYYKTKTDCVDNVNDLGTTVYDTLDTCLTGDSDQKFSCPTEAPMAPVAPPMEAPVAAPMAAPVAVTPISGPVSAPVTATPKAVTPATRTSSASNVLIATGLATTLVIVLA